jgi:small nuclear ribonucleoprotein (snRNP)-like protein
MVECKNGNTFNGTLIQCDKFMNVRLEDVVMTTKVIIIIYYILGWIKFLQNSRNINQRKSIEIVQIGNIFLFKSSKKLVSKKLLMISLNVIIILIIIF